MSNQIKKYYILIICFLSVACANTLQNPEFWMEKEINACLPTAIVFKQSLKKYNIWSEVFIYSWYDENKKLRGHAMTAYMYPSGKNQLWTYDAQGSFRIRSYKDNISDVAQKSHLARGWSGKTFNAEYIK